MSATVRVLCLMRLLSAAAPCLAQEPEGEAQPPVEIGGRIVISGETVEVRADPDLPPAASSIATKTDTPLILTPRSVSIVDSRVLQDMVAIHINQAHDFVVGFTPQDERGPEFAKVVQDWTKTARHPKTGRAYTEMVYQPMLELLAYIGKLDKALDEANAKGWTLVDMKADWKRVFPFEK